MVDNQIVYRLSLHPFCHLFFCFQLIFDKVQVGKPFTRKKRKAKDIRMFQFLCDSKQRWRFGTKCVSGNCKEKVDASPPSSLTQFTIFIIIIIIHMKKLLDSDWLRAVQFKCNTSAKTVTPVQKV